MQSYLDQATNLLFPQTGRQAVDVKFFFQEGSSTAEDLSRQIVSTFASMAMPSCAIADLD